jgi:hypothetical protein
MFDSRRCPFINFVIGNSCLMGILRLDSEGMLTCLVGIFIRNQDETFYFSGGILFILLGLMLSNEFYLSLVI